MACDEVLGGRGHRGGGLLAEQRNRYVYEENAEPVKYLHAELTRFQSDTFDASDIVPPIKSLESAALRLLRPTNYLNEDKSL